MNYDNIGKIISKKMISYDNSDNYTLNQLFVLFSKDYNGDNIDFNKLLMCTINSITSEGYDIVSTHPFKLERFK